MSPKLASNYWSLYLRCPLLRLQSGSTWVIFSLCVCVGVCMRVCVCVRACVWKIFHFVLFCFEFCIGLELIKWARQGILVSLSPQYWNEKYVPSFLFFLVGSGTHTQGLVLAGKCLLTQPPTQHHSCFCNGLVNGRAQTLFGRKCLWVGLGFRFLFVCLCESLSVCLIT